MTSVEKKIIKAISDHSRVILFVLISVLALYLRYRFRDYESADSYFSYESWVDKIRDLKGLAKFTTKIGEYTLGYQALLVLATFLPINRLYVVKVFPIVFDYVMAIFVAIIVKYMNKEKLLISQYENLDIVAYAVVLFLPTVTANSAMWGQCDAMYCGLVMAVFYCLMKEKDMLAFILYLVAFAIKIQAVFVLPFIIMFYLLEKRFSIVNTFIVIIPGILLVIVKVATGAIGNGTDYIAVFKYLINMNEYSWYNFPNFWAIVGRYYSEERLYYGGNYDFIQAMAIMTTIAMLGMGLVFMIKNKLSVAKPVEMLTFATWTVWTTVMFLPAMHDRYSYLVDILLIILCFINIKYLIPTVICTIFSTTIYSNYLFDKDYNTVWMAILFFIAYVYFTYLTLKAIDNMFISEKRK